MNKVECTPDFIFESSWEVCNKMGGIYTVLSTHAKTLHELFPERLMFIGPDVWHDDESPYFEEDKSLLRSWVRKAETEGLKIRVGRWQIPGRPCVVLVDFRPYFAQRDELYGQMWCDFGVDSLHGYGDYDEANMFSYAAALVTESYYRYAKLDKKNVVYHAHEWMTCLGALYLQKHVPQMATVFTTHATSIGRSIAGNGKPLYQYLKAYDGVQMSRELNIEAKHSLERQTAHAVDCFTTVSDVTALECAELLDKPCDAVLENGFEDSFVPQGRAFAARRSEARRRLFRVANALTGVSFPNDTLVVGTSGRYEVKNKGIDVFLESLRRVSAAADSLQRPVLAVITVPAWVYAPRLDLQQRLASGQVFDTPLHTPVLTHWLHNEQEDSVCRFLRDNGMLNQDADSKVKIIFVPCYLDGRDGIFDLPYYDILIGEDLAVYPSYYEPWGYTPLEAVAFHVPCVTTSLSGFGMWADKQKKGESQITDGVAVVPRDDYNWDEVCDAICRIVLQCDAFDVKTWASARRRAASLASKALWSKFIENYLTAYRIALQNAAKRCAAK